MPISIPMVSNTFNRAAPPYEPDMWNSQVTEHDLMNFYATHSEIILNILSNASRISQTRAKEYIQANPIREIKQALIIFNKAIENGESDEDIKQRFGISSNDIIAFKKPALDIYLGQGFEEYANCYSYAMNDPDRYQFGGDNPGSRLEDGPEHIKRWERHQAIEATEDYEGYKQLLLEDIILDGAIAGGKNAEPIEGYYSHSK